MRHESMATTVRGVVEQHEIVSGFFYLRQLLHAWCVVVRYARQRSERAAVLHAKLYASHIQIRIFSPNIEHIYLKARILRMANDMRIDRRTLVYKRMAFFQMADALSVGFNLFKGGRARFQK